VPGAISPPYEQRSRFEAKVARTLSNPKGETRTSHARTPHHLLNGTFTPNGLHFSIVHSGTPDIDPDRHPAGDPRPGEPAPRLLARGARALPDGVAHDLRRVRGNSAPMFSKEPIQASVQALHGLASCAEWTGVPLSTLLEETGIDPRALVSADAATQRERIGASAMTTSPWIDSGLLEQVESGTPVPFGARREAMQRLHACLDRLLGKHRCAVAPHSTKVMRDTIG